MNSCWCLSDGIAGVTSLKLWCANTSSRKLDIPTWRLSRPPAQRIWTKKEIRHEGYETLSLRHGSWRTWSSHLSAFTAHFPIPDPTPPIRLHCHAQKLKHSPPKHIAKPDQSLCITVLEEPNYHISHPPQQTSRSQTWPRPFILTVTPRSWSTLRQNAYLNPGNPAKALNQLPI